MRLFLSGFAAALALAGSATHAEPAQPAPAQSSSAQAAPATPPAPTAACPDAELGPSPADARAKLNAEQAEFARCQLEQNAASQKAHDDAVKANAELVARQKAEYEAKKAQYEEAMKRWHADVAACKAGNKSKCAKQ